MFCSWKEARTKRLKDLHRVDVEGGSEERCTLQRCDQVSPIRVLEQDLDCLLDFFWAALCLGSATQKGGQSLLELSQARLGDVRLNLMTCGGDSFEDSWQFSRKSYLCDRDLFVWCWNTRCVYIYIYIYIYIHSGSVSLPCLIPIVPELSLSKLLHTAWKPKSQRSPCFRSARSQHSNWEASRCEIYWLLTPTNPPNFLKPLLQLATRQGGSALSTAKLPVHTRCAPLHLPSTPTHAPFSPPVHPPSRTTIAMLARPPPLGN